MECNPPNIRQPVDGRARDSTLGLDTEKKTLGATERDEAARTAYRAQVAWYDQASVVVVDECGSNINLTPIYARAPKGERAVDQVPRNTEQNTTLIAAMTTQGMGAAMLLNGATDGIAFETYVAQFLVPTLVPGKIVVLDNLRAHKRSRIRELIEACGCTILYLPAYSPDLSPIEEAFSKLKALVRQAKARTRAALYDAIATALEQITAGDAQGYFAHCGYGTAVQ
jgi:transposase